jgi:putative flavoprotein involved in K+ transport
LACNPHVSGTQGGHDLNLRDFARRGVHLYGKLDAANGTRVKFSADLAERLAFADTAFGQVLGRLFDAYIRRGAHCGAHRAF